MIDIQQVGVGDTIFTLIYGVVRPCAVKKKTPNQLTVVDPYNYTYRIRIGNTIDWFTTLQDCVQGALDGIDHQILRLQKERERIVASYVGINEEGVNKCD